MWFGHQCLLSTFFQGFLLFQRSTDAGEAPT